ncbi:MAG: hypothetical protein NVSMB48_27410 [Marmoricola sp.]
MPYYKCSTCRVRLHVSEVPAEQVGDLCPRCGSLLEPVAEVSELVGLRPITTLDDAGESAFSPAHSRIADTVDGFLARRTAALERERAAPAWDDDDGDRPLAVAIALPVHPPR